MRDYRYNNEPINRRSFLCLAGSGIAAAALPLWGGDAGTRKERDDFFREGTILQLEIEVSGKDLDSLRKDPRKYVPATVKNGATVWKGVGLHLKGAAGSFRPVDDKPALTLHADKFTPGQRIHGLDKFHLNNSVQDPTYLMELLSAEMFHAADVPVSFCSHATVKLNGRNRGFYVLKEGYDKGFLQRYFRNTNGNLYDGGFLQDIDGELHLMSGKDDVKNRAELKALVQACHERVHAERLKRLEKLLNLEKFLTLMALEVITWHWDGYAMKRNNYRVYHEPTLDKIYIIPHGMDQMFGDAGGPIQPGFDGMVARGLVQTGEGKLRYRRRFAELMKISFLPEELVKRIDALEPKLRPVLASVDKHAGKEYPSHLQNLRAAIRQRAEEIRRQAKSQWQMSV